jgi:hypothetical protein
MINDITTQIKRDDGSMVSVTAIPLATDDGHSMAPNGAYDLVSDSLPDIGQLAFRKEDKFEWEYYGDTFTEEEIVQVVLEIQKVRE